MIFRGKKSKLFWIQGCIYTIVNVLLLNKLLSEIVLIILKKQFSFPLFFFFNQQDTKIASLERNIRDLEDEIQMLKANGVLNTEDREEEIKQIEVYKSHSKFMKTKVWSKVINFYILNVTWKLWFICILSPKYPHNLLYVIYEIYGQWRMRKIFSSKV